MQYVGKPVILVGKGKFDKFYSYYDEERYYSMVFSEIIDGGNGELLTGEIVFLYLDRRFKSIADILIDN